MIPKYYEIEFYDQNEKELFVHEFKERTKVDLDDYKPNDPKDIFYGWAWEKDSVWIHSEISELDQDLKLYAIWGRYEDRVVDKELDYKRTKKEDDSILKGEEKLRQKGEKGLKQLRYQEFIVGEKVIEKKLLEEKILKEPKDKIVLVGTKGEKIVKASPKLETKSKTESKTKQNLSGNKTKKEQAPSPKEKPSAEVVPAPKEKPKVESIPAPKENPKTESMPSPKENPAPAPTPSDKENTYKPIHGIEIIPNKYNDKFKNCDQLRTVYTLGVPRGHPVYENYPCGDRDKDGWA